MPVDHGNKVGFVQYGQPGATKLEKVFSNDSRILVGGEWRSRALLVVGKLEEALVCGQSGQIFVFIADIVLEIQFHAKEGERRPASGTRPVIGGRDSKIVVTNAFGVVNRQDGARLGHGRTGCWIEDAGETVRVMLTRSAEF